MQIQNLKQPHVLDTYIFLYSLWCWGNLNPIFVRWASAIYVSSNKLSPPRAECKKHFISEFYIRVFCNTIFSMKHNIFLVIDNVMNETQNDTRKKFNVNKYISKHPKHTQVPKLQTCFRQISSSITEQFKKTLKTVSHVNTCCSV